MQSRRPPFVSLPGAPFHVTCDLLQHYLRQRLGTFFAHYDPECYLLKRGIIGHNKKSEIKKESRCTEKVNKPVGNVYSV